MQTQGAVLFGFVFNKAVSLRRSGQCQGDGHKKGGNEMSHGAKVRKTALKFNNRREFGGLAGLTFDNSAALLPDFGGFGQGRLTKADPQRKQI